MEREHVKRPRKRQKGEGYLVNNDERAGSSVIAGRRYSLRLKRARTSLRSKTPYQRKSQASSSDEKNLKEELRKVRLELIKTKKDLEIVKEDVTVLAYSVFNHVVGTFNTILEMVTRRVGKTLDRVKRNDHNTGKILRHDSHV